MRALCRALMVMCWLGACGRSQPEHVTPSGSASSPAAATDRRVPPSSSPTTGSTPNGALGTAPVEPLSPALDLVQPKLLVAIGDLHGDLAATRRALRLAGAIDDGDNWIGGELVVVQTGDFLDRGDDERAIMDLVDRLRVAARGTGGAFVALSGNHELMNVAQDFRYVTPSGFSSFSGEGGRDVAFRPGGGYAKRLAERPVVTKVGDSVFVHAGVLPKHVSYGLTRMTAEVRAWMLGERAEPPAIIMAGDGPIWTRLYSFDTHPEDCVLLAQALDMLGAKRMVVGHTPQLSGITSACDDRVWRIDTGMSAYYGGPVEVLEIAGESVKPRKETAQKAVPVEE